MQLFHLIFTEPGVCGFAEPCLLILYEPPNLNLNWNLISFRSTPSSTKSSTSGCSSGSSAARSTSAPWATTTSTASTPLNSRYGNSRNLFSRPYSFPPSLGNGDGIRHRRAGELLLLSRRAHGSLRWRGKNTLKLIFLYERLPLPRL